MNKNVKIYIKIMLGMGIGIPRMSRKNLEIGDSYQGGIIFYLAGSGGLIAAPADETNSAWGCNGVTITGADGTAIGTGAQNTIDINADCTTANTAADRCRDKSLSGYTDWFLPSEDELIEMSNNYAAVGGLSSGYYWSSTEKGAFVAYVRNPVSGVATTRAKNLSLRIRAIRAF